MAVDAIPIGQSCIAQWRYESEVWREAGPHNHPHGQWLADVARRRYREMMRRARGG